jgi:hypothetical protein
LFGSSSASPNAIELTAIFKVYPGIALAARL